MTSVFRTGLPLGFGILILAGCGGSKQEPTVVETRSYDEEESSIGLPTVAIGQKPAATKAAKPAGKADAKPADSIPPQTKAPADDQLPPEPTGPKVAERKPPQKGSPEWMLEEIQRIKAAPLPGADGKPGAKDDEDVESDDEEMEKPLTAEEEQKFKEQFEKTKAVRRERNLQIIKLAELCIAATAKQAEQEHLFDAAVHYLLDARLQLALQGDAGSIDSLFEAAKAFYERKPDSVAAVESELTLVNLTHAFALRFGQSQPKWLQEFAKHSQLFASRFPDEAHRSVALLAAAARSCELAGMSTEATNCYTLLLTKFKDTPQAQQAAGVVRRMQLKGKKLELGGPTMDGGDLAIESYRGKMVVVIYWATHARPFVEQLPKLQATMKKYEKYAVAVGVNLDAEEGAVESFLEKNGITWPQIFSPNRALRGWNSPLAVHYGVNNLPTIWLVDPNGVVADTTITSETLEPRMREVYLDFVKAAQAKQPAAKQ